MPYGKTPSYDSLLLGLSLSRNTLHYIIYINQT